MDCPAVKASQNGSTLHVKTHLMARLTCRGVTRQTTQTPTALLHLRFRKRNLQVCLRICLTGQEVPCQAKEYEGCRQNIPLTSNITDRLEDIWTVKHFRGVTPAKALAGARFATQPLRRTLRSGIPYGHSCALDKCIYGRCCTFSKYACRCWCIKNAPVIRQFPREIVRTSANHHSKGIDTRRKSIDFRGCPFSLR